MEFNFKPCVKYEHERDEHIIVPVNITSLNDQYSKM